MKQPHLQQHGWTWTFYQVKQVIEKDKYHDIVYMQILKHDTNGTYLQNSRRVTDLENKRMVAGGEGIVSLGWTCTHGYISNG